MTKYNLIESIHLQVLESILLHEKASGATKAQIERVVTLLVRLTSAVQYRKSFKTLNALMAALKAKMDSVNSNPNEQDRGKAVLDVIEFFMDLEAIYTILGQKMGDWTQNRQDYIDKSKKEAEVNPEEESEETTVREPTIGELIDDRELKELDRNIQSALRKTKVQPLYKKLRTLFPERVPILTDEIKPNIIADVRSSTVPVLTSYMKALASIMGLINNIKKIVYSSKQEELISDIVPEKV